MKKIVIVEDNHQLAQMYQMKFSMAGYEVKVAYDGVNGLKLIERERPDIVLLDLKLPQKTGDEVLEELRGTDWGSALRVLVLTNISKDEAPMKLRFLNVDRYVVKAHHTPSQVVEIVKEVLG